MDSWEWCRTVYIASMLQVLRRQASKGGDSRFATIYSGRISLIMQLHHRLVILQKMAPDTLKILLLRWKPSLGVKGFGRDGKPSLSLIYLSIHYLLIYILCICLFYAQMTYIIMICLFVCYMQLCCLVLLLCAGCMLLSVESILEAIVLLFDLSPFFWLIKYLFRVCILTM